MDELDALRDLYGEPRPDPEAKARVRRRLEAESRRRARRRLSWTLAVAGTAVAAAAAVAAFGVIVPLGGGERQDAPVISLGPGRAVLLAAAETAAAERAGRDRYWHVRKLLRERPAGAETATERLTELWAAEDGRAWQYQGRYQGSRQEPGRTGEPGGATPGLARVDGVPPFSMNGRRLTVAQIQALPSDVARLTAWVRRTIGDDDPGVLADALSGLLWTKPSPPKVRAAAYRALADLPNVRYLGAATDELGRAGEAFSFGLGPRRRTLIIDPETSQVLSATLSPGPGAGEQVEVVLEAGWTDRRPPAG